MSMPKDMKMILGLNGNIDMSTRSSAARGILDAMMRANRWNEVKEYIESTRPEIDLHSIDLPD